MRHYPRSADLLDHDAFHALRALSLLERIWKISIRAVHAEGDALAARVHASDPDVPTNEDGEPLIGPDDINDAKETFIHGERDDDLDGAIATERLFRIGVHHTIEVFMKVVAADSHAELDVPMPTLASEDTFNAPKWFLVVGVDLRALPGADRLVRLRHKAGGWKHQGDDETNWLITNRPDAALWMFQGDGEGGFNDELVAARQFIPALVAAVKLKKAQKQD